jgi:YHS domain-containing protein
MLIRILLLIILLALLGRAIRSLLASAAGTPLEDGRRHPAARGVRMVRDPVCGTFLPPTHALAEPARDGSVLYFCSEACRQEYVAQGKRR